MIFEISGQEINLDVEDALRFVGVPMSISGHGYLKLSSHLGKAERYVHRIVMGAGKGQYVDHIDGNKLNNSKSNLRICSNQENACNARLRSNNQSGIKGVHWNSERHKWVAQLTHKGKTHNLGRFNTFEDAVAVRANAELRLQGQFSALNGVLAERAGAA